MERPLNRDFKLAVRLYKGEVIGLSASEDELLHKFAKNRRRLRRFNELTKNALLQSKQRKGFKRFETLSELFHDLGI